MDSAAAEQAFPLRTTSFRHLALLLAIAALGSGAKPRAGAAVTSERFTFSVQNSAGVPAPVELAIAITDEALRLIVPDTLEFGELLAGSAATKEIEIPNREAVTFVHRLGSALNANLHFHCAIIDGVWNG